MTEYLWTLPVILIFAIWLTRKRAWWARAVDYRYPRILMYHMICETLPEHRYRGLRVAPQMFEQQIAWLKDNGWTFVTMSELREQYESLPPKTVAITFDDGFLDNLTAALPVLQKYDAKATLYLLIDRHDNEWQTNKKAHHNSGEILREQKLTDEQVREMLASGLIELGGHTISHLNLQKATPEQKEAEIQGCRQTLQERFGEDSKSFAYPFGLFDDKDVELVEQTGFTSAVTTIEGIDQQPDFLRLKRIKISGKDCFSRFKTRMRIGWKGY